MRATRILRGFCFASLPNAYQNVMRRRVCVVTLRFLSSSILLAILAMRAFAQDHGVIVRGRVFRSDSTPIGGATVTVATGSGSVLGKQTTDRNGFYNIGIARDSISVRISAQFLGFGMRTVDTVIVASGRICIQDFYLARVSLPTVRVVARSGRRPRTQDGNGSSTEGSVRGSRVFGTLVGNSDANLVDLAATTPGLTAAPNGFSVAGLAPELNGSTINGMRSLVETLPRDAVASRAVILSTFDPSIGGFGGGSLAVQSLRGSNLSQRLLHITADDPSTQWSPATAGANAGVFRDLQLSGEADGAIRYDSAFYTLAAQVGQRSMVALPFEQANGSALRAIGVSPDSAAELVSALRRDGLVGQTPPLGQAVQQSASLFSRLDFLMPGNRAMSVITALRTTQSNGAVISPERAASYGSVAQSTSGMLQASYSGYFYERFLNETRLAIGMARRSARPISPIPTAIVLTQSGDTVAGSDAEIVAGGAPTNRDDDTQWNIEWKNETSWLSASGLHRWQLTLGSDLERANRTQETGDQGAFVFRSVGDYQAGRASAFTRTFGTMASTGSLVTSSAALGDVWQPTRTFRLQSGVRFDASSFLGRPSDTEDASGVFGVRATRPSNVSVSPRIGFSWSYGRRVGDSGTSGEALGTLRGGIGVFQSDWRPTLVENAAASSSTRELFCVGSATPTPDWDAYRNSTGSVPSECVSGATGPVAAAIPLTIVGAGLKPMSSRRATLGWSTDVFRTLHIDVDGLVTYGVNLASHTDLNLVAKPQFTLVDEALRPVFVPATSIDPRSGLTNVSTARTNSAYASVTEMLADMRSRGRSVTLMLSPYRLSRQQLYLAYTYTRSERQSRGFDATTAGDDRAVEWATSSFERRHQLTGGGTLVFAAGLSLDLYARLESGMPFTPIVDADLNGDGLQNDRAFIFDSKARDTSAAAGIAGLLVDKRVRSCLRPQLGGIAEQNSCFGPWSITGGAQVNLPSSLLGLSDRFKISIAFVNLPAAIDQLMHGSRLHGWGQAMVPDPILLHLRGFDPRADRYLYTVNSRFGQTLANQQLSATPFRITLNVKASLGVDPDKQILGEQLRQVASIPGAPKAERIRQYLTRLIPNVALAVARMRDSLGLTTDQLAQLHDLADAYATTQEKIWMPFATYLASLNLDYSSPSVVERYKTAKNSAYRSAAQLGQRVRDCLTESQVRQLSLSIRRYFDPEAVMRSMTDRF